MSFRLRGFQQGRFRSTSEGNKIGRVDAQTCAELLKQVREAADFLTKLPEKIASGIAAAHKSYATWRARVRAQKEVAELQELGKQLVSLYFYKGELVADMRRTDLDQTPEEIPYLKDLFGEVANGLAEVRETMKEIAFSNTEVATETALVVSQACAAYRKLSELPDDAIRDRQTLSTICGWMEDMICSGQSLMDRLDKERFLIDHHSG